MRFIGFLFVLPPLFDRVSTRLLVHLLLTGILALFGWRCLVAVYQRKPPERRLGGWIVWSYGVASYLAGGLLAALPPHGPDGPYRGDFEFLKFLLGLSLAC